MEPLLNIQDVSDLTKLNVKTLYTYVEQKRIPHVRLGRRILFRKAQVEEWVSGCCVPGNTCSEEAI